LGFVRSGAAALIIGSVVTCLVFAFHPSHIDPRPLIGAFTLSQIVHSAAILAAPVLLYGAWAVADWLGWTATARLGLVCAAFAMMLTVNAAVISSFVTPAAAHASGSIMPSADGGHPVETHHAAMQMPPLVQLSVAMNRGLAQVHVALWSLAILLFAFAIWRRSSALSVGGMLVGGFPLAWQLSGTFSPETHTMPVIVFAQSAWLLAVAAAMLRANRTSGAQSDHLATPAIQTA
jgi:hypothetical protein